MLQIGIEKEAAENRFTFYIFCSILSILNQIHQIQTQLISITINNNNNNNNNKIQIVQGGRAGKELLN